MIEKCCSELGEPGPFKSCTTFVQKFCAICKDSGKTCLPIHVQCTDVHGNESVTHAISFIKLDNGLWCIADPTSGRLIEPCFPDPANPNKDALCIAAQSSLGCKCEFEEGSGLDHAKTDYCSQHSNPRTLLGCRVCCDDYTQVSLPTLAERTRTERNTYRNALDWCERSEPTEEGRETCIRAADEAHAARQKEIDEDLKELTDWYVGCNTHCSDEY